MIVGDIFMAGAGALLIAVGIVYWRRDPYYWQWDEGFDLSKIWQRLRTVHAIGFGLLLIVFALMDFTLHH